MKKKQNTSPKEFNFHDVATAGNKLFRVEIGLSAYKNKRNDYAGKVGYIFFCNTCCKDWRVQFFTMGNNELLRNFDFNRCIFFMADKR